jgi:hypothetical protein
MMLSNKISVNAILLLGLMTGEIWMNRAEYKSARQILKPIDHMDVHRKYVGGTGAERFTGSSTQR